MARKEVKDRSITGKDFEISVNSVIFKRLAEEGHDLTPQNLTAFRRVADDRLARVKRKDGSITYALERDVIEHLAAKLTYSEKRDKEAKRE